MRFSQRKGLLPVRVDIQRESIDEPLRNKLWTAIQLSLFDVSADYLRRNGVQPDILIQRIWIFFFNKAVDTIPAYGMAGFREAIRQWFFKAHWYEAYDFIEALTSELKNEPLDVFTSLTNKFLEQEMAAYRLIETEIAEITSEEEIASIEGALKDTEPLTPVRAHLKDALAKLTDRKNPDYRNSIKESISAVEALCQRVTGDPKATLGHAIKRIKDSGVQLHPSLEQAWGKLYGYTSDQGGIRHALSDEPNISFADAKYMLVTCSAFISYLTELASVAGLQLTSR
jgi:AbiJ N-terminal domain 4